MGWWNKMFSTCADFMLFTLIDVMSYEINETTDIKRDIKYWE